VLLTIAGSSAVHPDGIVACLPDVADDERRAASNAAIPVDGTVAPRARRRSRSRPDVLTADGWEQMHWTRWRTWLPGDPRWDVTIIDTTGQPIEQTALTIQRWITQARADQANGRLVLAPGWATPPTDQAPVTGSRARPRRSRQKRTPTPGGT
jgi:hypothetical protein